MLNSKTSSDIFNFLDIDAKVNFAKSINQLDEPIKSECLEYMEKKPYRWAYIVYKAQEANKLKSEDLKEISNIAIDLEMNEIETSISDKRYATSKVDDMMKSFIKLEN